MITGTTAPTSNFVSPQNPLVAKVENPTPLSPSSSAPSNPTASQPQAALKTNSRNPETDTVQIRANSVLAKNRQDEPTISTVVKMAQGAPKSIIQPQTSNQSEGGSTPTQSSTPVRNAQRQANSSPGNKVDLLA